MYDAYTCSWLVNSTAHIDGLVQDCTDATYNAQELMAVSH